VTAHTQVLVVHPQQSVPDRPVEEEKQPKAQPKGKRRGAG
jgi:hypothetical protein